MTSFPHRLRVAARVALRVVAVAWSGPLLAAAIDVPATAGASPQSLPHYRLLEQSLPRYQALAAQPGLTQLAVLPRRSIKPGEAWEGIPALRALLAAVGDLPASPAPVPDEGLPAVPPVLDADLVEALKRFQDRHGLEVDGVLGPATWRALTTPLATRVRQIERTLERWRELPPNPHARAIFINIPRFRLYGMTGMTSSESQMLRIDVVVGQAVRNLRTPVFTADLTHVIFRPYWDVPRSITRNEILPALRADPAYLERHHFELVDGRGRVVAATAAALEQLAAGTLRVRQRPGADNALGAVKFMMPNPHDVYLHDTPARTLFARTRRAFSHGCIRVADPAALARFVLQEDPVWTPERIAEAMARQTPLRVDLAEPIRVYIVYGTAIAREDGSVLFLEDLYGLEQD